MMMMMMMMMVIVIMTVLMFRCRYYNSISEGCVVFSIGRFPLACHFVWENNLGHRMHNPGRFNPFHLELHGDLCIFIIPLLVGETYTSLSGIHSVQSSMSFVHQKTIPCEIKMEPKNGGLEDDFLGAIR